MLPSRSHEIYCSRSLVKITGSIVAAVILQYLIDLYLSHNDWFTWIDGRQYIAIQRSEWYERCMVSAYYYDSAIKLLIEKGLVVKKLYKDDDGFPVTHLSLETERIESLL